MNNITENFNRDWLKENIALCNESQQQMFKRMYSHNNLDLDVNSIIDKMPEDKLDWAMQQVQHTLEKDKEVI